MALKWLQDSTVRALSSGIFELALSCLQAYNEEGHLQESGVACEIETARRENIDHNKAHECA